MHPTPWLASPYIVTIDLLLRGGERATAWRELLELWPNYAKYAARTDREIPVFPLTPLA